jgi:hypothetical protein
MRVIDAAMYLMDKNIDADFSSVFSMRHGWFKEERLMIRNDRKVYDEDIRLRSLKYSARVNGASERVPGIWLDHPQSILFKIWARNDPAAGGYSFIVVDCSTPDYNRYVISVDPESAYGLNGLGQELERHESLKRKATGNERPVNPIRLPSDNSDPWYFGQGHNYTIVDSPRAGTVLSAEEVRKIHETW